MIIQMTKKEAIQVLTRALEKVSATQLEHGMYDVALTTLSVDNEKNIETAMGDVQGE